MQHEEGHKAHNIYPYEVLFVLLEEEYLIDLQYHLKKRTRSTFRLLEEEPRLTPSILCRKACPYLLPVNESLINP